MSHSQEHSSNVFTIECEDLILRAFRPEDLDDFHALTWEPHFHEYLIDWNVPKEQREEWFIHYEIPDNDRFLAAVSQGGDLGKARLRLGIFLRATGEFIGVCGTGIKDELPPPNREILYGIASKHRNKGYTTQAAQGLIKYLFEHTTVRELIAIAETSNVPSNSVIRKCGFDYLHDVVIEERSYHYYMLNRN
ncbi:RimJ/RimL family protein N-acetyltransferase [Paenibacillus cellulosilyticus]|uniref:RimJ/RimL family protein N-acetyltransferase n=1 Tax=Paenibacillus cellulosilyticus TaxID=375489 RepID=A0A2V2YZD5_9BACL|nr:GNAT family N-acetyltransferase [Paenibacillus cellulosilyticus]PWW05224.1 RimJ/RimL family protein N-acetyltransferase [Paenibacillus cellulosilyticus]QKS43549.1 GNAT family N-acetyltransferase [Paenibacillus cellulosilyticus]